MDEHKKRTIEKWRDYFIYNVADESHENLKVNEEKSAEEMISELTESDEY